MNQIEVRVKLYSTLERHVKNYNPLTGKIIQLPEGATVGDLIRSLGLPPRGARLVSIRNGVRKWDFKLKDGDLVSIFALLSGG